MGRAIVKRVKFFQTYCVPGVVVAGLVVSIVLGILRASNVLQVDFDVAVLKEWFMDIFFTGVGLTASWKLIKSGGKVLYRHCRRHHWFDSCGRMSWAWSCPWPWVCIPSRAWGLGSLSLMAGVGTSGAIAPSYEALGAENAHGSGHYVRHLRHGVRASLTGGPVARALIKRHHLAR